MEGNNVHKKNVVWTRVERVCRGMAHVQQVLKEDIQPTCTIVNMETVMKMNVAGDNVTLFSPPLLVGKARKDEESTMDTDFMEMQMT
jgi:hypothetical protein